MLALDPPGAERLTVGEAFAAARSGRAAHRYGAAPRPGARDGGAARRRHRRRGGGKVVKTVAGYDLPKLVHRRPTAALGEMLELTLRLHPLPAATCTWSTAPADPLPLEPLAPACVEYAWPPERMLVRFESPVARELAEQAPGARRRRARGRRRGALGRATASGRRGSLPAALPAGRGARRDRRLRPAGATTIVGRSRAGMLLGRREYRCRPRISARALERRVVEAFGG